MVIRRLPIIIAYCLINHRIGSKTFSSVTEIWVWWTSRDPSLKQRMLTWQICWLYGWSLAVGCYDCFQCQHSTLFSSTCATLQTYIDKQTNLKKYNSGLGFDCLGTTCFLTLHKIAILVWVATPTMRTTGSNA